MIFCEGDNGPFYMSEPERLTKKYDQVTDDHACPVEKTKEDMRKDLQQKGIIVRRHCSKADMMDICRANHISLTKNVYKKVDGWMGKLKGLLQVLWERGWINEGELSKYSLDGKQNQRDDNGNILREHRKYVLRTLMSECADFKEEKSAMEHLLSQLSLKSRPTSIRLMTSPKYHCEVAGEGIEYAFGMMKRFYRNLPLSEKNTREKFNGCVRRSILHLTMQHIIRFSGKCRRYMLTYQSHPQYANNSLTYASVERFTKQIKTKRNIADQDKAYISQVWKQSLTIDGTY